ncbi:MAG: hypothetical protein Q7S02_03665 [bacterium]|nr:hypothetical protein [bacterium]
MRMCGTRECAQRRVGIAVACVSVAAFFVFVAPRVVHAAASDNVTGWAWSAEAGWVSMNATNCIGLNSGVDPDPCTLAGNDYGVTIAANGSVSGYAWSRAAGWACVGATCVGSGGATPAGGWTARVNAITGQLTGWGKLLSLGDGGWISFSCENTATCGTVAYRTTANVATGIVAGNAWSSSSDGHGLGWMSLAPQFGGVTTTWRPEPLCSVTGLQCRSDVECGLPGEFCCLGGAPCGRCGGDGDVCGSNLVCGGGILCCREGVDCGQCTQNGAACGRDADCPDAARDSCCPPGAVCGGGRPDGGCNNNGTCGAGETAANCPLDCGSGDAQGSVCDGDGTCEAGEAVTNCASDCGSSGGGGSCNRNGACETGESLEGCPADCSDLASTSPIGVCSGGGSPPTICVDEPQCASGATCNLDLGICSETGVACANEDACPGGTNTCDRDIGIQTDGPDGQSIPCTDDDPNCRKVIGKCTDIERLCTIDANCPDGEQCGKLFLPWLQTQFGSIYSGGSVGSSQTPPPPSGQVNATYCILAGGPIVNFLSTSGVEGCREVRRTPYPKAGQPFTLPKLPSYVSAVARIDVDGIFGGRYGRPSESLPTLAELTSGYVLGGKVFQYTGDGDLRIGEVGKVIQINNGVGNANGAGLFVVRGKHLFIDSDIVYGGGQVTNIRNLASPGFLVLKDRVKDAQGNTVEVGGNIIIAPSVTRLAGAFYAEGEIHTSSTTRASDDQSLVVTGVMVAKKFLFDRLFAGAQPAEQIVADGRVLANPPPGLGDLARSLPTITQTVP